MDSNNYIRLAQIFSAKLVLEVFGGGGAIWGFSEAIGFRVPHTVWFWRPCALTFGFIFFCRWLMQIRDYIAEVEAKSSKMAPTKSDPEFSLANTLANETDRLVPGSSDTGSDEENVSYGP